MKFKYKVVIRDLVFEFDDEPLSSSAETFASIAASHLKSDDEVIIKVEVIDKDN